MNKAKSTVKQIRRHFRLHGGTVFIKSSSVMRKAHRLRLKLIQAVCAMLIISFLTNSISAEPQIIVAASGEFARSARFGFYSHGFDNDLSGWSSNLLLFLSGRGEKKVQETPSLNKIMLLPGNDLKVRQGEPVNFSAIGIAADGTSIGGLKFSYTVEDVGRKLKPHNLPDGTFSAAAQGDFLVRAETNGLTAESKIVVQANDALNMIKQVRKYEENGNSESANRLKALGTYKSESISSRSLPKNAAADSETKETEQSTDSPIRKGVSSSDTEPVGNTTGNNPGVMMRPPDDQGWDNGNWQTADDPGNQTGNPQGTSPDAAAGNGNFQLSAPVISLPGRGIDLSLTLNYNSRAWSKAGNKMIFDADQGFPAPGWNLGFGKMLFMGTSGGCMLIGSDGTRLGYTGTISNYTYGNYSSTVFIGHTTNGNFIDYSCSVSTYNGVTSMSAASSLSNGTKVYYYANSINGKQAFPTQIIDAQGNYISIAYRNNRGPEIQNVIDTLGRVVNFNYDSLNRLISVDVPKLNNAGMRTAVRLHYKQITLNPGFAYPLTTDTNNASPYVVDAIYYPGTSTGYWFGADPNASDYSTYYSSYGMLARVVAQRGMNWSGAAGDQGTVTAGTMSKQAEYSYPLTPDYTLTDAPTFATLTESWAGMDTTASVTSYSMNMNASPRAITVTQPNGLISKQYSYNHPGVWDDGLIYQDETLDAASNQLSKSVVIWNQGAYDSPRPAQTETTDERGQVIKTVYTYGANYNQVISKKEYDYDGTSLFKDTRSSFENNNSYTTRHIFNLVKTNEIFDKNNNRVTRTDYEFDNNAVVNGTQNHNLKETPGVTMHLATADPFTAETIDGACINGYFNYPQCTYDGEIIWVYQTGAHEETCVYECTEYEQISAYDPNSIFRGNVTKVTSYSDAANLDGAISQTKKYDATGNVVAESASCCELKTYDYNITTQYAYPTSQTRGSSDPNSPLRNTNSALFDFNTGLIKQSTDPNGKTNYATYNPDSLRLTVSTSSTGAYSQTTYNDSAMTVTEEAREANGTLAGKIIKYLNGIGQINKEESYGPNNIADIIETKYTKNAEEWKQSRPYRAGDTPQFSEKFYDLQGRLTKIVEPGGSETKSFYNETLRPDSASALPGNTVRVMDAWGRERWGRYDQQGRITEVVEPNPNGNGSVFAPGSLATKYTNDILGKLIKTEQGSQIREFKYDSLGRLTRQKLAEQAATLNDAGAYVGINNANAKWSEASWFDNRSNLISKTDARGVKSNYSYQIAGADDPLNRIQSRSYDLSGPLDPSLTIHPAPAVTYEYETSGDKARIKKIRTAGILTEDFTYDGESRVSEYKQTVDYRDNYPMTASYLYDTLDRITEVHYPAQYGITGSPRKVVAHSYDSSSRLTGLTVDGQQQASNIVYDASDQTTSIKIGPAALGMNTGQVTENYTFDSQTGLMTNQTAVRNGATLLNLSYDYNKNNSLGSLNGKTGHLTKIVNNLDNAKNREYEFDALGRLTKAKGGNTGALWNQNYSYDRYGNRTNVTASGVAANNSPIPLDGIPNLIYNALSNRITTAGFEYDSAGNQTRALAEDGVTWLKYEYDAANRLQIIKKDDANQTLMQAFQFGSTNIRLIDYNPAAGLNTFYASFGGTTLAEYTEYAQNIFTWVKSQVYLGDRLLSTITSNGIGGESIEYDHPDRLGTRLITSKTGKAYYNYEQVTLPFGTSLNAETSGTNTHRFTSYERSVPTGLDYALNRTYDSKQGRFTQVDPIGMNAVDVNLPQSLNLYNYCGNDPINRTDPNGLSWFSKLFHIFKVILNVISNIIKIAVTVAIIITLATTPFGWASVGIIALLVFQAIVPNLISIVTKTIYRSIKQSIREDGLSFGSFFRGLWRGIKQSFNYLKSIFTRSLKDYFAIVYGYFCGPGYGLDGPTRDQKPIDGLDSACQQHDRDSAQVDEMLRAGLISKKEANRLKTKYDLRFMLRAISSGNMASGGYLLILELGFLFLRVIPRLFS